MSVIASAELVEPIAKLPILPQKQEEFNRFLTRADPPHDHENQLVNKHLERILAIFQNKVVPPYEVEIQPTSKCNLACKHCFAKALTHGRLEDKIHTLDDMRTIASRILDFRENGFRVETLKFCGTTGEPLVSPLTIPSISMFKELDSEVNVVLFTNGLYLDKEHLNKPYWHYVLQADKIIISLDSASRQTFFNIKGIDGFQRIINNIRNITENKDSLDLSISYVISELNFLEIENAANLAKCLGADEIRYRIDFTNRERLSHLAETIEQGLDRAMAYSDNDFRVISIYSPKEIEGDDSAFTCKGNCFNQYFWACVGPNAELYSCGHHTYKEVESYGSLLEDNSFRDLWTSQKRLAFSEGLPDDYCKFCSPSSAARNRFCNFLQDAVDHSRIK